ncbi:hypothetical protein [Mitsuokella sp. AF21-1AC]|uniref:hypothetical protein n=1 Tax=Mitsuokella sp. AF21-1AC TaxID=2292235 RepID=UPI0011CB6AF9|nr:hypothetical protein [Mitsuokella sp. AF21-1AC]
MICRRCGCMLDKGTRICPFCGEPVTFDETGRRVDVQAGQAAETNGLPELVALRELSPVPGTREETIAELRRLQKYFSDMDEKYAVLEDLWMMSSRWRQPSRSHWLIGGGLLALLLYLLIGIHFPAGVIVLFLVLWGLISYLGYQRSWRAYLAHKRKTELDIRTTENQIRNFYNDATRCFLPLDYTSPEVFHELILGLDSGMITSFEDYRINN